MHRPGMTCSCHPQAALPYKSKPKVMAAQKRQTLEQKRAVVLEPAERRAVSLVQQLNALRNDKAVKKREKQARQRQVSFDGLRRWRVAGGAFPSFLCLLGFVPELSPETHETPELLTCIGCWLTLNAPACRSTPRMWQQRRRGVPSITRRSARSGMSRRARTTSAQQSARALMSRAATMPCMSDWTFGGRRAAVDGKGLAVVKHLSEHAAAE